MKSTVQDASCKVSRVLGTSKTQIPAYARMTKKSLFSALPPWREGRGVFNRKL